MKIKKILFFTLGLILFATVCYAQLSKLKTYGFFDVELEGSNQDNQKVQWSFHQHHFNIISVFQLDDRFRVFGEFEWEHGVSIEAEGESSGLVALERGWVEYKYSDAIKVKTGKFLSPFGIYNLIHDASPTFLSTVIPSSIYGKHENTVGGEQMLYPKFATGVQVLGTIFTNQWEVDYFLYLSNGRGPNPSKKDDNSNKGLGGRLIVTPPINDFRLGVSYYTDENGNAYDTEQSALAFDAVFEYSNFSLESEFIIAKLEEADSSATMYTPNSEFRRGVGSYIQGAYTFFDQLTPFARYVFYDEDVDEAYDGEVHFVAGINYSVTPKIYLKSEIHFVNYENAALKGHEKFVASIAVAF